MHPRGWFDYTPDGWVNPTADKDSLSVVMALPFQRGFHITPTKYFTLSFIHVTRRFLKALLSGCLPRSLPKVLSLCRRSRCRSLDGSLCRGPLPRLRRPTSNPQPLTTDPTSNLRPPTFNYLEPPTSHYQPLPPPASEREIQEREIQERKRERERERERQRDRQRERERKREREREQEKERGRDSNTSQSRHVST